MITSLKDLIGVLKSLAISEKDRLQGNSKKTTIQKNAINKFLKTRPKQIW